MVCFEQAIVGVLVEINSDWFFDCSAQFLFQILNKVRYPVIEVVVVPIGDKDIVCKFGNNRGHISNIINHTSGTKRRNSNLLWKIQLSYHLDISEIRFYWKQRREVSDLSDDRVPLSIRHIRCDYLMGAFQRSQNFFNRVGHFIDLIPVFCFSLIIIFIV